MARKRMRQMGVALDEELRKYLEARAKTEGQSIADEIRNRLNFTLDIDRDAATLKLIRAILHLAFVLRTVEKVDWHSNLHANKAMAHAIGILVDELATAKPLKDEPGSMGMMPKEDPDASGRILARMALWQLGIGLKTDFTGSKS
jgi:plasmid stability protein